MDKIAVLIPCYNEEKTIAKVVSDVKKFLPEAVTYVYDNNSTDVPWNWQRKRERSYVMNMPRERET